MKKPWLAILILFATAQARAVPSISSVSGSLVNGATVTVNGSGAGTHADYSTHSHLMAAWNNFEGGTVTRENWFYTQGTTNGWSPSNVQSSTGSLWHAERRFKGVEPEGISISQSGTTGEYHFRFDFMMLNNTQSGKFWRIYGSGAAQNIWLASGGNGGHSIRGFSECTDCSPAPATVFGGPTDISTYTWHQVDIYMSQSISTFSVFVDQQFQWGRGNWVSSVFGGDGHTIDLGHMIDNFDGSRPESTNMDGAYAFDNVSVDYAFSSEIFLSTSSTLASTVYRVTQVPLSWSNTQQTISVNQGLIQNGQVVYLYVCDSGGRLSCNENGYQLTFGSTYAAAQPTSTSGTTMSGQNRGR